jgi:hypothetical protein
MTVLCMRVPAIVIADAKRKERAPVGLIQGPPCGLTRPLSLGALDLLRAMASAELRRHS